MVNRREVDVTSFVSRLGCIAAALALAVLAACQTTNGDEFVPTPDNAGMTDAERLAMLQTYMDREEFVTKSDGSGYGPIGGMAIGVYTGNHFVDPACEDLKITGTGDIVVTRPPIKFGQNVNPISGAWPQEVYVEGCGRRVVKNAFWDAKHGKLDVGMLPPGATRANPDRELTTRVSDALKAQLRSANADCHRFGVVDTIVDDPAGDAWSETWWAYFCDDVAPHKVTFRTGADGTVDFDLAAAAGS